MLGIVGSVLSFAFTTAVAATGVSVLYNKQQKGDFDSTGEDFKAAVNDIANDPKGALEGAKKAGSELLASTEKNARLLGEAVEHPIDTIINKATETAKKEFEKIASGNGNNSDLMGNAMTYGIPAIAGMLTKGGGGGWFMSLIIGVVSLGIMNSSAGDSLKNMINSLFNDKSGFSNENEASSPSVSTAQKLDTPLKYAPTINYAAEFAPQ